MRSWNEMLMVAAEAVNAGDKGAVVIRSLEAVVGGAMSLDKRGYDLTAEASECRALLAALDRETRLLHAQWDDATLRDVRAALRILPSVIEDLQMNSSASVIADRLKKFTIGADTLKNDGDPTAAGWLCLRCGSHAIDEQHTDGAPGGRHIDLLCEACYLSAGFTPGSAEEGLWYQK